MSKYDGLQLHLALQALKEARVLTLSLEEVDGIVGGLPQSARTWAAWWANSGQPHSVTWTDAGWKVAENPIQSGTVKFQLADATKAMTFARTSPQVALAVLNELIPEEAARRAALSLLADAIERVHELAPARWAITLKHDLVRLNVGRILVVDVVSGSLGLALEVSQLGAVARRLDAEGGEGSPFAAVPGVARFEVPANDVETLRPELEPALTGALRLAAKSNTPYKASHSPGVLGAIATMLNRKLPSPEWAELADMPTKPWNIGETVIALALANQRSGTPVESDVIEQTAALLSRNTEDLISRVQSLKAAREARTTTTEVDDDAAEVIEAYRGADAALARDAAALRGRATRSQPLSAAWKIAPGEQAEHWARWSAASEIRLGFSNVGDLAGFADKDALTRAYRQLPEQTDQRTATHVAMLWPFVDEVLPGDIVVANRGQSVVVGRGTVTGPYRFDAARADYRHARRVKWFDREERAIPSQGTAWNRTLVRIGVGDYERLFGQEASRAEAPASPRAAPTPKEEVGSIYRFIEDAGFRFSKEAVSAYLLALSTKPFVILSGVSGTGKTKLAQLVAEWAGTTEETERTVPVASPMLDGAFELTLHPYVRKSKRVVMPRAAEVLFELPEKGSVPAKVEFGGTEYDAWVALLHKTRELYAIRLEESLVEAMFGQVGEGGVVRVQVDGNRTPPAMRITPRETVEVVKAVRKTRHEFISVRPDWLDGKSLLGYWNPIAEEYAAPPFLRLLLRAHTEAVEHGVEARPYFVILDEMNLARVEHYFSDLLSATESRRLTSEGVMQEPLALHTRPICEPLNAPPGWSASDDCRNCAASLDDVARCTLVKDGVLHVPAKLQVPLNVYVTGTVNVDETTHMFSPKVLDRANVIEFNEVWLTGAPDDSGGLALKNGLCALGQAPVATLDAFERAPKEVRETIAALNELLRPHHAHFGFRAASEIALFVENAVRGAEGDLGSVTTAALDLQILQKVLPKLHGPRSRMQAPIAALLCFALAGPGVSEPGESGSIEAERDQILRTPVRQSGARYPRSAYKLARMHRTLEESGFVAFIE